MANRTCSIEGCTSPARARTWCATHYGRWRSTGSPGLGVKRPKRPGGLRPLEVLEWHGWSVTPAGCWEWAGNTDGNGYGRVIAVPHGWSYAKAHRASYEVHHGPIPDGLVVRHTCDNPPCVNPDHLELGSQWDNAQDMVERGRSVHSRDECQRGHDLTAPGAYHVHTQPDRSGRVYTVHRCRICYQMARRRSRENRRARRRAATDTPT